MTSPLLPEAVAQMVAELDMFSRCGDVGVMDRDMAIDAKAMITTLAAENATLRDAASQVLHDIDDLVANSQGVTGLHQNGDVAEWPDILEGGSFEAWLRSVETLRAAITPTAEPTEYERKVAQMKGDFPNGI